MWPRRQGVLYRPSLRGTVRRALTPTCRDLALSRSPAATGDLSSESRREQGNCPHLSARASSAVLSLSRPVTPEVAGSSPASLRLCLSDAWLLNSSSWLPTPLPVVTRSGTPCARATRSGRGCRFLHAAVIPRHGRHSPWLRHCASLLPGRVRHDLRHSCLRTTPHSTANRLAKLHLRDVTELCGPRKIRTATGSRPTVGATTSICWGPARASRLARALRQAPFLSAVQQRPVPPPLAAEGAPRSRHRLHSGRRLLLRALARRSARRGRTASSGDRPTRALPAAIDDARRASAFEGTGVSAEAGGLKLDRLVLENDEGGAAAPPSRSESARHGRGSRPESNKEQRSRASDLDLIAVVLDRGSACSLHAAPPPGLAGAPRPGVSDGLAPLLQAGGPVQAL
jgi:hypothetical protein